MKKLKYVCPYCDQILLFCFIHHITFFLHSNYSFYNDYKTSTYNLYYSCLLSLMFVFVCEDTIVPGGISPPGRLGDHMTTSHAIPGNIHHINIHITTCKSGYQSILSGSKSCLSKTV